MAARYVQITREELESWLNSVKSNSKIKGWSRDQRFKGVYLVHLSEMVSVKLSSTIGTTDDAKGKGKASMNLTLVSRLHPQVVLNKKARDRARFHRTTNWKDTWLEGILHWAKVYDDKADFYDNVARIPDRSKYTKEWIAEIESIPNWANYGMLVKHHETLTKGYVLWPSGEEKILKLKGSSSQSNQNSSVQPLNPDILRDLYRRARAQNEGRAMQELKRLGLDAVAGKIPSDQDRETYTSLRDYFGI